MSMMINDSIVANELIDQRRAGGADRYDEVWEGVYVMAPMANNEHQGLATEIAAVLMTRIGWRGLGQTLAGANVSDRREGWTHNFRIPDEVIPLQFAIQATPSVLRLATDQATLIRDIPISVR